MLQILIDESMVEHPITTLDSNNICKVLTGLSKKKGEGIISILFRWYIDSVEYICYGWITGCCVNKNIHNLLSDGIPSSDYIEIQSHQTILYGDIFILKKKNEYLPLKIEEYGIYYIMQNMNDDECEPIESIEKKENNHYFKEKESNKLDNSLTYDTMDYTTI